MPRESLILRYWHLNFDYQQIQDSDQTQCYRRKTALFHLMTLICHPLFPNFRLFSPQNRDYRLNPDPRSKDPLKMDFCCRMYNWALQPDYYLNCIVAITQTVTMLLSILVLLIIWNKYKILIINLINNVNIDNRY